VTLGLCFFLPFLNVVSIDGDFSQGDVTYESPFFSGLHGKKFHEGGANNISIFPLKKKPYLPRASDLNSNNLHNKSTFSPCNLQSALYNYGSAIPLKVDIHNWDSSSSSSSSSFQ
jgi:hypothetical protein